MTTNPSPISGDPRVQRAFSFLVETDEATLTAQIELSEIPAPPFQESVRGLRLAELFRSAGLRNVRADEVGNVLGMARGDGDAPPLVVSAHLDTVSGVFASGEPAVRPPPSADSLSETG